MSDEFESWWANQGFCETDSWSKHRAEMAWRASEEFRVWTRFTVGSDPADGTGKAWLSVRTWGHVFQAEIDPRIPEPYGVAAAWRRIGEMMADHVRREHEAAISELGSPTDGEA